MLTKHNSYTTPVERFHLDKREIFPASTIRNVRCTELWKERFRIQKLFSTPVVYMKLTVKLVLNKQRK